MPEPNQPKLVYYRVAVPVPLYRVYDYLPPKSATGQYAQPGSRVLVPFGRGKKVAVVLALVANSDVPDEKLKHVETVLDPEPLLQATDLELLQWAANYYQHPLGEVMLAAFPVALRQGQAALLPQTKTYRLSDKASAALASGLSRAPAQRTLLLAMRAWPDGISDAQLRQLPEYSRSACDALLAKACLLCQYDTQPSAVPPVATAAAMTPNAGQQAAIDEISAALGKFSVFLLDGVTGSGKTEVYMQVMRKVLDNGQQVLVLLPEIALTPQLLRRFQQRFGVDIAVSHSNLTDTERKDAWLRTAFGNARILLGTRSALFTPLHNPGLIILDEEHDSSFKQQEGFRFSARDLAVMRGQLLKVPVLLGSATPSLESLHNANRGRYRQLHLAYRAGGAEMPPVQLLDIRSQKLQDGLSDTLLAALDRCLQGDGQALLFINRRGFAPTLICHSCAWVARCRHCDANLVVHKREHLLRCHHCAREMPLPDVCPACAAQPLTLLGQGTERVEAALQARYPEQQVVRLDRDSTSRKGSLETLLAAIAENRARIILGTQMLAKGHHFPNVALVAIIDADSGLFGVDFRATERLAQLVVQVAGRAGRADKPGKVLLQTRQPQHPLLQTLIREGYAGFAHELLRERRAANLPPYAFQTLLRAEARDQSAPAQWLAKMSGALRNQCFPKVEVLGPVPAPMSRRADKYRQQLLLQSESRPALQHCLQWLVQHLQDGVAAKGVRWTLDVDPQDLY